MKLTEVLSGIQAEAVAGTDCEISALAIDSRKVSEGSLFICLKGLTVDGHDYIDAAIANGAAAVLCENVPQSRAEHICYVQTEDTRKAMALAAANFYGNPAAKLKLIGVTGTNGKTSTTYYIDEILRTAGKSCAVIGTTGVMIAGEALDFTFSTSTTPDPIELQQIFSDLAHRGIEYVVMEVSSHALALEKLAGLCFEVSTFSNLTQDHLDFHQTMEAYGAAKAKLFGASGVAVINSDDSYAVMMKNAATGRVLTYGIEPGADLRATDVTLHSGGVEYNLELNGALRHIKVPVPGRFTVYNTLSALAAAHALGVDDDTIITALSKVKGVPGRIQNIANDLGFTVLVDYAHSPDGLQNVLSSAREFTRNKLICVFGCGGNRDRTKRPKMAKIAGDLSDLVIITSDNPRDEEPDDIINEAEPGIAGTGCDYLKIADRREAIFKAIENAQAGDCVVIAGKGHEDYQELKNKQKIHFDDREVAAEALKAILNKSKGL